jgi:hypothetical protein
VFDPPYRLLMDRRCVAPDVFGYRLECRVRIFSGPERPTVVVFGDRELAGRASGGRARPPFDPGECAVMLIADRFELPTDETMWFEHGRGDAGRAEESNPDAFDLIVTSVEADDRRLRMPRRMVERIVGAPL